MKEDKIVGETGNTVENLLLDELNLIKGFLNAIDILKIEYKYFDDIDSSKIISLMIGSAMKESRGSLNPAYVGERAKDYLCKFDKNLNEIKIKSTYYE